MNITGSQQHRHKQAHTSWPHARQNAAHRCRPAGASAAAGAWAVAHTPWAPRSPAPAAAAAAAAPAPEAEAAARRKGWRAAGACWGVRPAGAPAQGQPSSTVSCHRLHRRCMGLACPVSPGVAKGGREDQGRSWWYAWKLHILLTCFGPGGACEGAAPPCCCRPPLIAPPSAPCLVIQAGRVRPLPRPRPMPDLPRCVRAMEDPERDHQTDLTILGAAHG